MSALTLIYVKYAQIPSKAPFIKGQNALLNVFPEKVSGKQRKTALIMANTDRKGQISIRTVKYLALYGSDFPKSIGHPGANNGQQ